MKKSTRKCTQCGAILPEKRRCGMYICEECAEKMGFQPKSVPQRDFPVGWSIDDKAAKAAEMGMSYGKFVALVHDGTINIAELTKPERPARSKRGARRKAAARDNG